MADSKEMAGKLSSLKKFAEDEDNNKGIVGLILSNSSKSFLGAENATNPKGSIPRSSIEF